MIRQVGVTFLAFVLIFSSFGVTGVETAVAAEAGPPYPGGGWEPQPASYGIVEEDNISIEMSDGTKLLAKIYRPADLETGEAVDEEFPEIGRASCRERVEISGGAGGEKKKGAKVEGVR